MEVNDGIIDDDNNENKARTDKDKTVNTKWTNTHTQKIATTTKMHDSTICLL